MWHPAFKKTNNIWEQLFLLYWLCFMIMFSPLFFSHLLQGTEKNITITQRKELAQKLQMDTIRKRRQRRSWCQLCLVKQIGHTISQYYCGEKLRHLDAEQNIFTYMSFNNSIWNFPETGRHPFNTSSELEGNYRSSSSHTPDWKSTSPFTSPNILNQCRQSFQV